MKKSLLALAVLVAVLGLMLAACDNPAADPVVNVRLKNGWTSTLDLECRLGSVYFNYSPPNPELAVNACSEYKPIAAGVYKLESNDPGWWEVDGTELDMTSAGNYTVTFHADYTSSIVKD